MKISILPTKLNAFIFLLQILLLIHPRIEFASLLFSQLHHIVTLGHAVSNTPRSSPSIIWNPEAINFRNFFALKLECLNLASALLHLIQFHCFILQDYPAGDDEDKVGKQWKSTKGKRTKCMKGKRNFSKGNSASKATGHSGSLKMKENKRQNQKIEIKGVRSKKGRLSSIM